MTMTQVILEIAMLRSYHQELHVALIHCVTTNLSKGDTLEVRWILLTGKCTVSFSSGLN